MQISCVVFNVILLFVLTVCLVLISIYPIVVLLPVILIYSYKSIQPINFIGHPHLKRMLCPDGFVGHPLRKDFKIDKLR
ncbi:uncharacterized protein YqhQ [Clostridium beijerinckii]|nr:uncharacterized protein YqhQ [Clostridium beijerinckii]NRT45404.1 uncharacterized protein YqhQ [Clostridium beijerinckii]NRZ20599.1 uncharacterized protein YqhQ [Clostridium beijerinckii]